MTHPHPARGNALRLSTQAASVEALELDLVATDIPPLEAGHAIVEVKAAAVNPSDVKAALGMMPHAVWPRTPGRDFAGRVVAGPAAWRDVEVWGTGGDLGITRDGSHAQFLVLPESALVRKPAVLTLPEAATIGVPFVTASEGLRRAGLRAGHVVVVFGANGKVGQAAVQLASRCGATVVGVDRGPGGYVGHASAPIEYLDGSAPDLPTRLREALGPRGADIAYNTVGSPYFAVALETLAVGGTQILISTIERTVPFDILGFYRRNLNMLGVDTLKLSASDCARILEALVPGFETGELRAFGIEADALVRLDAAAEAYRHVLHGSRDRLVLTP